MKQKLSLIIVLFVVLLINSPSKASVAKMSSGQNQKPFPNGVLRTLHDSDTTLDNPIAIALGHYHTCTLLASGDIKCWGGNNWGQLGNGTGISYYTPVNVSGLSPGVSAIASGYYHNCAILPGGELKCWGWNLEGQLGDGTTEDRNLPVNVSDLSSGVSNISGGGYHTCAITSSGEVKCWGRNSEGQLGDGTTLPSISPVDVAVDSITMTEISLGNSHSCSLTSGGGVMCWGYNNTGALGDDSTTNRLTPVNVTSLSSGVKDVVAGGFHTCSLKSGGIKCWGWNLYGQLGDNSNSDRHTPVDVFGLSSGVKTIGAGRRHTCVITTGGGVKCWGENSHGQLGDRTTTNRSKPVDVEGLSSGVVAISLGVYHTCAITETSHIKCWGANNHGQQGDGTKIDRLTPVDVVGFGKLMPSPFLDLPVNYSIPNVPESMAFVIAATGSNGGTGPGRVNSWFDHELPLWDQPNEIITRWDGYDFYTQDNISVSNCDKGKTCYDYHNGTDFRHITQNEETVYSAAPGKVIVPTVWGYGREIMIDHHNGYATLYGHLVENDNKVFVEIGDELTQSHQPLGIMGDSGISWGIHLHFGLYYDKNNNGLWTEDEVVDPYGWQPLKYRASPFDPWLIDGGMPSIYIWKYPLNGGAELTPEGGVLSSASGLINIVVPQNSVSTNVTLEIWDLPSVSKLGSQLRSLGQPFLLRVLEWITEYSPSSKLSSPQMTFLELITITHDYSRGGLDHLNEDLLQIFRWEEGSETWIGLPSSVDKNEKLITAHTTDVGEFDVQAPLICPSDLREPDDNYDAANAIPSDGTLFTSLFDISGDNDWFSFKGIASADYTFQTDNLADGVDTIIEIFDIDGLSQLSSDDNSGEGLASKLSWTAPATGIYYLRVSQNSGSSYGCDASYQVSLEGESLVFLPISIRK